MNRTAVCGLALCLMFAISLYLFFCNKHFHQIHDEDLKYLQNQGWTLDHMNNHISTNRQKRSIASICNGLWRLLNYPYMYNFYPILNFGVGKIMSGLGSLINNIHFPLFSSATVQPLSQAELQAQELANAQGQALSQEVQTSTTDYTDTSPSHVASESSAESNTSPPVRITYSAESNTNPQQSQGSVERIPPNDSPPKRLPMSNEYQESPSRDEEMRKEREEEELMQKDQDERMGEFKKKINDKAEVLAKKYVEKYFSQNTQLAGDLSMSAISNMLPTVNDVELPKSIEDQLAQQNT